MDFAAISDFINNIGFPIAMVVAMGYLLYKEQQNHKEEMDSMREAINNNTNVMTKLETMIQDLKDRFMSKEDDA